MKTERSIKLKKNRLKYRLRKSPEAREMKLSVTRRGSLVLTVPKKASDSAIRRFIISKADWILDKLDVIIRIDQGKAVRSSRKDYLKNREMAREFITNRVRYFSELYGFRHRKIRIKNQRTVWGSCSEDGSLNFNYILFKMPKDIADYIIVHELCHLRQFNHSEKFWDLVGRTLPGYKGIKKKADEIVFV